MNKKHLFAGIIIILVIAISIYFYQEKSELTEKEQSCINSGGEITTMPCYCEGVEEFPDICEPGICTCNPAATNFEEDIRICECQQGKCFNGSECITSYYE